ncbi:MAG: hypothetical protein NDJ89_17065 [Oligoflexia bacterium]|nr:hypothetical protein [Oligoflexia bacterium]
MKRLRLFLALLWATTSASGWAGPAWKAELATPATSSISGLILSEPGSVEIDAQWHDGKPRFVAHLRGTYQRPGWSLVYNESENLAASPEEGPRPFDFTIPIRSESQSVLLLAIGQTRMESLSLEIRFREWPGLESRLSRELALKPIVSLGASSIRYEEPGYADFSVVAALAKLAARYPIPAAAWELHLSASLAASLKEVNDAGRPLFLAAELSLDARVLESDRWRVLLRGGFRYANMIVRADAFGYDRLLHPQVFPVVRGTLANGDMLEAYAKWAPLGKAAALLNAEEREIAFGMSWGRVLRSGTPVTVSLDFSSQRFQTTADHVLSSTSWAFAVGAGLF